MEATYLQEVVHVDDVVLELAPVLLFSCQLLTKLGNENFESYSTMLIARMTFICFVSESILLDIVDD